MAILDYFHARLEVLREKGDEVSAVCPACGDKKQKFWFNHILGLGHCFRGSCDWRGGFVDLITIVEQVPWIEARGIARKWGGVAAIRPRGEGPTKRKYSLTLPPEYRKFENEDVTFQAQQARAYLRRRRITEFEIEKYDIGFSTTPPYAGRVLVPTFNDVGECIFFIARKFMAGPGEKVLNPPEAPEDVAGVRGGYLPKSDCLFGLNLISKGEAIVLVEGVWDAIAINRAMKKDCCVAMFGTSLSDNQKLLLKHRVPMSLCAFFDPEVPCDEVTAFAFELRASLHTEVKLVAYPKELSGKDPDELPEVEVRRMIERALTPSFQSYVTTQMPVRLTRRV